LEDIEQELKDIDYYLQVILTDSLLDDKIVSVDTFDSFGGMIFG
jgi:hypothetical protein